MKCRGGQRELKCANEHSSGELFELSKKQCLCIGMLMPSIQNIYIAAAGYYVATFTRMNLHGIA